LPEVPACAASAQVKTPQSDSPQGHQPQVNLIAPLPRDRNAAATCLRLNTDGGQINFQSKIPILRRTDELASKRRVRVDGCFDSDRGARGICEALA
jgi:hypothetical protein